MVSESTMDSFLDEVLKDCGLLDDFLDGTLLDPGLSSPPASPLASQPVADAESDSDWYVDAFVKAMGWEELTSGPTETVEDLLGDSTSASTDNAPASPGVPCVPTTEPESSSSVCRKRKHDSDDSAPKPYIKKPLNAFMIFKAEERLKIMAELGITNSAAVNRVVGECWRSLSAEEQAPYFQQAHRVRKEHEAMHPGWSASQNFGKKVKRRKRQHSAALTYGNTSAPGHFHLAPSYQPQPAPAYSEPAYYGPAYYGPAYSGPVYSGPTTWQIAPF